MAGRHRYPASLALAVLVATALTCDDEPRAVDMDAQATTAVAQAPEAIPSAAVSPAREAPAGPATVERPAQVTDTPVPPDTPTRSPEVLKDLKGEVYFSAGGGADPICEPLPLAMWEEEGITFPHLEGEVGVSAYLCLRGFPLDEDITVDLYAPDGAVHSALFWAREQADHLGLLWAPADGSQGPRAAEGVVYESEGITSIGIRLWLPPSLPTANWHAVARSTSAWARGPIAAQDVGDLPLVDVVPDAGPNPFRGERRLCRENAFSAGEQIQIVGANFPHNTDLALGIYHTTEVISPSALVHAQVVATDSRGHFRTSVLIAPSDPPGHYYVVALSDPESQFHLGPAGYTCRGSVGLNIGCFRVP